MGKATLCHTARNKFAGCLLLLVLLFLAAMFRLHADVLSLSLLAALREIPKLKLPNTFHLENAKTTLNPKQNTHLNHEIPKIPT